MKRAEPHTQAGSTIEGVFVQGGAG